MENGDRGGFPSEAQLIPAQDGGGGGGAPRRDSAVEQRPSPAALRGPVLCGMEWRPLGLRLPAPGRATVSRDSMGQWGPITNNKGSFGD